MLAFMGMGEDLNTKLGEFHCGQHNPFLLSFQKQGPSHSVPLLYMLIFHKKSDSFRVEFSPQTKGRLVFRKHRNIPADSQPPQKSQTAGLFHC